MNYTDNYNILPNLYIRTHTDANGVVKYHQVYPCEGYVLRIYALDEYLMDDDFNYILDENGNKILTVAYRTYGGATAMPNYNWETNPKGYTAELYEEGMEVFGAKEPEHEVM